MLFSLHGDFDIHPGADAASGVPRRQLRRSCLDSWVEQSIGKLQIRSLPKSVDEAASRIDELLETRGNPPRRDSASRVECEEASIACAGPVASTTSALHEGTEDNSRPAIACAGPVASSTLVLHEVTEDESRPAIACAESVASSTLAASHEVHEVTDDELQDSPNSNDSSAGWDNALQFRPGIACAEPVASTTVVLDEGTEADLGPAARTSAPTFSRAASKKTAHDEVEAASTVVAVRPRRRLPTKTPAGQTSETADFCKWPRIQMQCYNVLGISRYATPAEVRQAYRRKAMQVHPDKGGDPTLFVSVAEAFETLSDNRSRIAYDLLLDSFASSDGLGANVDRAPVQGENHDLATLVHVLCEMSPAEWPSLVIDLPSSSLSDIKRLIEHSDLLENKRCPTRTGIDRDEANPAGCQLQSLLWQNQKRYWYVQVCVGRLRIRSTWTRCINTASQWHMSVLTLKNLFQAHRDQHENKPVEESLTAAFAQAKAQKIFFPGANFVFWCEMSWKDDKGTLARWTTPHVHQFDIAMKHRKQLWAARSKGKRAMRELRDKLTAAWKATKSRWQAQMRRKQKLLRGYIFCELCNRSFSQTSIKRRLTGKQTVTTCLQTTVALSKLAGMMVQGTTKNKSVQRRLRTFLQSHEANGLRCLLHDAVHFAMPQAAIGGFQTGVHVSNSMRKRKFLCITDAS